MSGNASNLCIVTTLKVFKKWNICKFMLLKINFHYPNKLNRNKRTKFSAPGAISTARSNTAWQKAQMLLHCLQGQICWISLQSNQQTAAASVKAGKFTDTLKVQQQSKERGSKQKQMGETSSATNGGEVRWGKSWINKYSQTRLLTHHFLHKSKNLPVLHVQAESQWEMKLDVNFNLSQSQVSVSFPL